MKKIFYLINFLSLHLAGYGQWDQKGPEFEGDYLQAQLGFDVAMDSTGGIVAYSEIGFDNGPIENVGRVKVFYYEEGTDDWVQFGGDIGTETLGSSGAQFGRSVSLSANGLRVAICAPYYLATQGATFIYDYNPITDDWDLVGTILGSANQYRGFARDAVSLSSAGNRVAIGANNRAYVYEQNDDGTWSMLTSLARTNHQRVSLNAAGDRLLSINYAGGNGNVYEENEAGLWNAIGGAVAYGFIGEMNAAGDRVVLGRYDIDRATVYELIAGDWLNIGSIEGEPGSRFGIDVSINDEGSRVNAGAYWGDLEATNKGYMGVYFHNEDALEWVQIDDLIIGETGGDEFGVNVEMNSSGNTVIGSGIMAERAGFAGAGFAAVYGNPSVCIISGSSFNVASCDSFTVPSGDETYYVSGEYYDTIPNACGRDSIMLIDVTIHEEPTVTATSDLSEICLGESFEISGAGADTYVWDDGLLDGESRIPETSGLKTYTVTGTDENGCENTATIEVMVHELPEVTASVNEDEICVGKTVVFKGSGALSYEWDNDVVDGENFESLSTGLVTYTVVGTDVNTCQSEASVDLIVHELPEVVAHLDKSEICLGEEVIFSGSGAEDYDWDFGVENGEAFRPFAPGTMVHTVFGTDLNGCSSSDEITLTTFGLPSVEATVSEESICDGESVVFTADGAFSYEWDHDVIDGTVFQPDYIGTESFHVTGTDENGCIGESSINLTVFALPVIAVSPNQSIYAGETAQIELFSDQIGDVLWSPDYELDCADCRITDVMPSVSTTYQVLFIDENQCQTTDSVRVEVLPVFTADKIGISPNDDGFNDKLEFPGIGVYPNATLVIFNRWGENVYSADNGYQNDWGGTNQNTGDLLPSGSTCYFVLDLGEADLEPVKGYIYISY